MMDVPAARWIDAIAVRRSRRQYDGICLPPETRNLMERVCRDFRPFPEVRSVFLPDSFDDIFTGILGSYGRIKGAAACVCFLGMADDPRVNEKIGYTGEGIILEATALGLGTCWVGGFLRPEVAARRAGAALGERVFAVTPVGTAKDRESFEEKVMTGFGRTHRRRPLHDLVSGTPANQLPRWLTQALDAARIAPSAVNRQPWRFHVADDTVIVSTDNLSDTYKISKRLDCGIAMLHFEVAALSQGVRGQWEPLDPPGVGRWITAD